MRAVLLDAGSPLSLYPVTATRPLSRFPLANVELSARQTAELEACGLEPADAAPAGEACFFQRGDAWLSRGAIRWAAGQTAPAVVTDAGGKALAWVNTSAQLPRVAAALRADAESCEILYPWDLLRLNAVVLAGLPEDRVEGVISAGVTVEGRLSLGRGSRLLPGVFIEGHVVIGCDCKIGPNAYLRGSTSIGDDCHVGQAVEIKSSVILPHSSLGHLSYCGDSIVGEGVNFGAGTITANFRHDGKPHRCLVGGDMIETGLRKLGALVGDGVHTGIHTGIYPGRKIWPGKSTRPGEIVSKDLV